MAEESKMMLTGLVLAVSTAKALIARGVLTRDELIEDLHAKALAVDDPLVKAAFDNAISAVKNMPGPS